MGQAGNSPGGGFGTRPRKYFRNARPRISHHRSTAVNFYVGQSVGRDLCKFLGLSHDNVRNVGDHVIWPKAFT